MSTGGIETRFRVAGGLPDLRMAPASEVLLHEEAELARVDRLSSRLREDGVLRNPPLVAALLDGGYVVLDGANRASALIALGAGVIPVQVVEYAAAGVRLDVWSHYLPNAAGVPSRLQAQGVPIRALARSAEFVPERNALTCYIAVGEDIYEVDLTSGPAAVLSTVVGAYKGTSRIYRVPGLAPDQGIHEQLDRLARDYGVPGTLVIFPLLAKTDILAIARAPKKLPTGITRHVIAGRALRLNIPLEVLTSAGTVDEKDSWLSEYIRGKLLDNRVRYYPEATFLFDE